MCIFTSYSGLPEQKADAVDGCVLFDEYAVKVDLLLPEGHGELASVAGLPAAEQRKLLHEPLLLVKLLLLERLQRTNGHSVTRSTHRLMTSLSVC